MESLHKKAKKQLTILKEMYSDAACALEYKTPFQLLVATVLSAQCTDKRVNIVTASLFKTHPDAHKISSLTLPQLEKKVHSTGFYKNKAKSLSATSKILVKKFKGTVPNSMDELIQLPGVGRKTANVILGNAFGIASGIVVDTHVTRISRRLGLTQQKDPVKIEQDLCNLIPQKDWVLYSHLIIAHGRAICTARKKDCCSCPLQSTL
jgi:endonuclease III